MDNYSTSHAESNDETPGYLPLSEPRDSEKATEKPKPSKQFYNNPSEGYLEHLQAIQLIYPCYHVDLQYRTVILKKDRQHRVGIVSGGGSGHEPYPVGFIAHNMLTAAAVGPVFTSPSTSCIFNAVINAARYNQGGLLIVILNYTGDILNFGLAIEKARLRGLKVAAVTVADDIASANSAGTGRRGLCGAIFVLKIVGALSAAGRVLEEIACEGRAVVSRLATMGASMSVSAPPGQDHLYWMDPEDMEIGVGIHGEAGTTITKIKPVKQIVSSMLSTLCREFPIRNGGDLVVMINNLGGTSSLEMNVIANETLKQLKSRKFKVYRVYVGTFVTSLDMKGFQICLLNITNRHDWLVLLDSPTDAPYWTGSKLSYLDEGHLQTFHPVKETKIEVQSGPFFVKEREANIFRECLRGFCQNMKTEEKMLNALDSVIGDGDTGTTLRLISDAILSNYNQFNFKDVSKTLRELSQLCEVTAGGTMGALFSLMLIGASNTGTDWLTVWKGAIDALNKYSSASLGDRTMMDVLVPAYQEFAASVQENKDWISAFSDAVEVARKKCLLTINMAPKAGRGAYVGNEKVFAPDAGAYAFYTTMVMLETTFNCLSQIQGEPGMSTSPLVSEGVGIGEAKYRGVLWEACADFLLELGYKRSSP